MKFFLVVLTLALACSLTVQAQQWEIGGGVGGAFSTAQTYTNSKAGSADASLDTGLVTSVWAGDNAWNHLGGEFRYDYETTKLKLSSGSTKASFGADTHAVHYDLLWHFASRESRMRPFVAAGGGVRVFRGTGTQIASQPLQGIALLTKTTEVEGLVSVGGGVKFRVNHWLQLRVEAHDFLSPFPTKVIAPAQGTKTSGWLNDFVPMAALAVTF